MISSKNVNKRDIKEEPPVSETTPPLISLITPAYNEEAILEDNLVALQDYMSKFEGKYDWEIIVVNDGSRDNTGRLADELAARYSNMRVHHHRFNKNLGGALQTGFRLSKGDYVIVLDIDLSYGPDHIEMIMEELEASDADLVLASPYMKGGRSTKVPFSRLLLSRVVNFFMRIFANENIHTFTGMVRGYKGDYIRSLNLKSTNYAINPEIIHKSILLRKRIVEIPAHLDWSLQLEGGAGRTSSIKILQGILSGLMSGFIFRPYAFFLGIGGVLLIVAAWVIMWIFYHTYQVYPTIEVPSGMINDQFSEAVAAVFRARPHAFFVGGICLIVSLQFLGIGFLSLQSKRYFDELFHINSRL